MMAKFKRGMGAAIILISTTQPGWAEVTAQDVWSDWKGYMTSAGYEVSGSETSSGGTLTISDLSMAMLLPQNEGSVSINMASLVFTGNGDGTVTVTMPAVTPVHISGQEDGENFDVVVNYSQNGHSMVASGSPNDLNYNYTASQVGIALASLMVDGQALPQDLARVAITLTNVISSTQMKTADMRNYSQRMSADSLTFDVAFDDPESDDNGAFNGSVVGLSMQGSGEMPLEMDPQDFQAMLADGFSFSGVVEYASGNSTMNAIGDGEEVSFSSSSQGGEFGMSMDAAQISYNASQKGTSINVTTNQLPFPVAMELAEVGFGINMPVAPSDQEQDFAFLLKLDKFTMSDMIWGLFDPGEVLPRDPATIVLDLAGRAKILVDYLDPDFTESLSGPPGELNALTINQLLVSVAGSKLSGNGDFTFDNSDLDSFDGLPAPTGAANLELIGANGLMDKLIQMGLMQESDAMGARMMMGMLAVPGEGEDTMTSKIEINDQGHISANGQRIK